METVIMTAIWITAGALLLSAFIFAGLCALFTIAREWFRE